MPKAKPLILNLQDTSSMAVPILDDHDADTAGTLTIEYACAAAISEIAKGRKSVTLSGEPLFSDPNEHPDTRVIRDWLVARHRDLRELRVIFWLMHFVRSEWASLPHRTSAQHRALYSHISKLSRELSEALDETGCIYIRGGGYGMEGMDVRSLLTDSEAADFASACKHDIEVQNRDGTIGTMKYEPRLPTLQELLERVASAAQRLERQGPPHTQPKKHGAKRGYFVRRIAELFQQRYGERPHEVIAALTTIALGEATDRELVAKLLA